MAKYIVNVKKVVSIWGRLEVEAESPEEAEELVYNNPWPYEGTFIADGNSECDYEVLEAEAAFDADED